MVRDISKSPSSFLPVMSSGSRTSLTYKPPPLEPGTEPRPRKASLTLADTMSDVRSKVSNARSTVAQRLTALKSKQNPKVRKPIPSPSSPLPAKELRSQCDTEPSEDDQAATAFAERRLSRKKVEEWAANKRKLQPSKKKTRKPTSLPHLAPVAAPQPAPKKSLSVGGGMFLMLAVSKFKIMGNNAHKRWEADKAQKLKAKTAKKESERAKERQAVETLADKLEDEARHNKITIMLGKERLAHEKLMSETNVMRTFTPPRADSASQKFVQGDGTVRPDSAEAWSLGIDVLKLQDKLNAIGPGSADAATLTPKARNYPADRPRMHEDEISSILDDEVTTLLKQKGQAEKRKVFLGKKQSTKSKSLFDIALKHRNEAKVKAKLKANAAALAPGEKRSFRSLLK